MQEQTIRFYQRWVMMMKRCYIVDDVNYSNYGARGIYVCSEWHDPNVFVAWCFEHHDKGLSIDRINNDGPYSPDNCIFATPKQQNRNTRANVWVEYEGERVILADLARKLGIKSHVIRARMQGYPNNPEVWFVPKNQAIPLMRAIKPEQTKRPSNKGVGKKIQTPWGRLNRSEAAEKEGVSNYVLRARIKKYPDNPELWFSAEKSGDLLA